MESHDLSNADLISFVFYMQSLFGVFSNMGSMYTSVMQSLGASEKVFRWVDREPKIISPVDSGESAGQLTRAEPVCRGEIQFDKVTFSYPTRSDLRVLNGLSFQVKPGQVVALCGPSGGGKSSIVALIQRFYDTQPGNGEVRIDGQLIQQLPDEWLRANAALVAQEPILFSRSIRENILFGFLDAVKRSGLSDRDIPSFHEIQEAAKRANAHDFIMSFPDGYDTQVGERGAQLSGGQKQRIAIARALVRRPRILFLDEATSALDAQSEEVVQEAIDRMIGEANMTVLVIAHRLSTIRNADSIVVIERGALAEQGSHDELLAKKGVYYKLVTKQLNLPESTPEDITQLEKKILS